MTKKSIMIAGLAIAAAFAQVSAAGFAPDEPGNHPGGMGKAPGDQTNAAGKKHRG